MPSLHVEIDVNGNLDRDMVAMMEAQRREFPQIDGLCQLTTLTQHTVTQRILRRWSAAWAPFSRSRQMWPAPDPI